MPVCLYVTEVGGLGCDWTSDTWPSHLEPWFCAMISCYDTRLSDQQSSELHQTHADAVRRAWWELSCDILMKCLRGAIAHEIFSLGAVQRGTHTWMQYGGLTPSLFCCSELLVLHACGWIFCIIMTTQPLHWMQTHALTPVFSSMASWLMSFPIVPFCAQANFYKLLQFSCFCDVLQCAIDHICSIHWNSNYTTCILTLSCGWVDGSCPTPCPLYTS